MAPGVMTHSAPTPSHQLSNGKSSAHSLLPPNTISKNQPSTAADLDRKLFPDGLKTSGQHAGMPSALRPYSEFPKHIQASRNLWKAEDYKEHPERWTHPFTQEEISELAHAADTYIASGRPLTGMARVSVFLESYNEMT